MKLVLEQKIRESIIALQEEGQLSSLNMPEIHVERPKGEQFGDYTSNIALMLAQQVKKSPLVLAEMIQEKLLLVECEKIEVVKPGYINFFLTQEQLTALLSHVLSERSSYGNNTAGQGIQVNNEFISANPTGPLHLGNGRGGFFGDVLARILRKSGYMVINEYYVNDAGEQTQKLGHSVLKDAEAVYGGEYIEELRSKLFKIKNQKSKIKNEDLSAQEIGEKAAEMVIDEMIKRTLREKMHITFDAFVSEKKDILEAGWVDKALDILQKNGKTFEQDGALWLQTTAYGDDKDRVLIKKDGVKTYFASDCGYILHKMERGFDRMIEIWGADHHGYVERFKAAAQALGFSGKMDFILVQMVRLVKDGKEVRMSKRAGNVVTIDELIEKVGHDVARFFFLLYAPDTHMNFDLGLAEEHSQKNPVFYVQYAYARLASMLRKSEAENVYQGVADMSLLTHIKERELIREILFFPELIEIIAHDFSVHRLPQYAIRLADKLHSFYDQCRVLDGENMSLSLARLELIKAVQIVLKETLDMMGVTAPEKM
ncbi:MAG TPA: arginine--tRNA ligase [Patescibacteria group bacterium]|nr:arginine--tRNA ligase [Patescibacteria group bacterium]